MTTETLARAVISVRNITKSFGDQRALNGVDLDIQSGEFLSLLGPSGCGKTTLLRLIGGFEEPDGGDILLQQKSVLGVPPHRRTVNTVFQAYALFPHMSVAENVAYGLRQKKLPKKEIGQRVAEALDLVRMREYADRPPRNLSGGQQQRVAIARAIVNRPDVLLLDEPLSALDRKLREQMQVELKLLQRHVGITFVFVTHDQGEALAMSDRIVVMREGRIDQIGSPQEVYENPATAFVAEFIGTQNFSDATVAGNGSIKAPGTSYAVPVEATAPFADGSAVRVAVRAEAVSVRTTPPVEPDNWTAGTLAGSSFLGGTVQHIVHTPDGREIIARTPVGSGEALTAGQPVWCTWPASAVRVYQAEDAV